MKQDNENLRGNSKQRDFHRYVRVVYRACRKLYGKEKTQDECLKVFKVIFPELYKLRNCAEEKIQVPLIVSTKLLVATHDWNPHGKLAELVAYVIGTLQFPVDWNREDLMQFYEDIMPVVMRIRKLTPRECFRLMGMSETDIDVVLSSGISNSACYKLAGNSIVVDVMTAMFDTLFINTEPKKEVGMQLSLF